MIRRLLLTQAKLQEKAKPLEELQDKQREAFSGGQPPNTFVVKHASSSSERTLPLSTGEGTNGHEEGGSQFTSSRTNSFQQLNSAANACSQNSDHVTVRSEETGEQHSMVEQNYLGSFPSVGYLLLVYTRV